MAEDPNTEVAQRCLGWLHARAAQNTLDPQEAVRALKHFSEARELENSAQNQHNHLRAEKMAWLMARETTLGLQAELRRCLGPTSETWREAEGYLRGVGRPDQEPIPVTFVCPLSLVG